jgi:hypothetical protein
MKVEFYETGVETVGQIDLLDKDMPKEYPTRKFKGGPIVVEHFETAVKLARVMAEEVHTSKTLTVAVQNGTDKDQWDDKFSTTGKSSEVPSFAESEAASPTDTERPKISGKEKKALAKKGFKVLAKPVKKGGKWAEGDGAAAHQAAEASPD